MPMNPIDRARNIVAKPKSEWPVIASEMVTAADLYTRFIAPLAAIPVLARLAGGLLFGYPIRGVGIRFPSVGRSLAEAIIDYGMSLLSIYLIAVLVSRFSPIFFAKKPDASALKLVAYSATPTWIGGIFGLFPSVALLQLIASFYSLYLFYLGLPIVMGCPPSKAPLVTAATAVTALILWTVTMWIV
jgi:hypothetical protein